MTVTTAQAERVERAVARSAAEAQDVHTLLRETAAALRPVVPFRAAALMTVDPATMLFTDGLVEHFDADTCTPWFELELGGRDVHHYRDLAGAGPVTLRRSGLAEESRRWRELMRPQGLDDELRAVATDASGSWATIELHRAADEGHFAADEAALVGAIRAPLAAGIRRLALTRAAVAPAVPDGPGLLHVHRDGTAEAVTAAGEVWLERLLPARGGLVRTALIGIAQLVLAAGADAGPQRLRVRAANGAWVTLHASPMRGEGPIAVIVEPTRQADIVGITARAYGLTEREREVVLAVARGDSTKVIAGSLYLSEHTVRDHVKSALAKVGVSSRGELVATLFERHYAASFFESVDAVE